MSFEKTWDKLKPFERETILKMIASFKSPASERRLIQVAKMTWFQTGLSGSQRASVKFWMRKFGLV